MKNPRIIIPVVLLIAVAVWSLRYVVGCSAVGVTDTTTTASSSTTSTSTVTSSTVTTSTVTSSTTSSTTTTTLPIATGIIDPAFGTGGVVVAANVGGDSDDSGSSVLVDGSERPVVTGYSRGVTNEMYMVTWRYGTSGSLDTGFDGDGVVFKNNATPESVANYGVASVRDSSGNLYVAGYCNRTENERVVVVWKLLPNGADDTGFGYNGRALVTIAASSGATVTGIARDGGGNLYLCGYVSYFEATDEDAFLIKLDSGGVLVADFGPDRNGIALYHRDGHVNRAYDVTVDAGNRAYLCGSYGMDSGIDAFAVWRFNPNGTIDNSFGSSGVALLDNSCVNVWRGITLDHDGKVLVCGSSRPYKDFANMYLARYTSIGVLDTTFCGCGYTTYAVDVLNHANSLATDQQHNILVGGYTGPSITAADFTAWRYTGSGELDTSFGNAGLFTHDIGERDFVIKIAQNSDGQIYLTGRTGSSTTRMALLRIK